MIAEIKWVGSKRLENHSGHKINGPPKMKYVREYLEVERVNLKRRDNKEDEGRKMKYKKIAQS